MAGTQNRRNAFEDYAGIFFSYWRGFLAAQQRVVAYGGNVVDALKRGMK